MILGAAVIDDVFVLVILAVVTGLIASAESGTSLSAMAIAVIIGKAVVFLVGGLAIGTRLSPRMFVAGMRLRGKGVLLAAALSFCFLMSWLASAVGLAPIVGAYAAGLILERTHYRALEDREEHTLEALIHPIAAFLVPIFFVLMGMRTDLRSFAEPGVIGVALALTAVAIVGKLASAFGVLDRTIDRRSVAIGMIPRGALKWSFSRASTG